MTRFRLLLLVGLLFSATIAQAQIFGTVRGTVLDPQKLPIPGATVTLKARGSAWSVEATTNDAGEFSVPTVPAGSLNIANSRFLLGRDSAFAGTHYNDPREVMAQVRYRFHY